MKTLLISCFELSRRLLLAVGLLVILSSSAIHIATLQHKTQGDVLQYLDQQQTNISIVSTEHQLSFSELMNQLKDKRLVFVGEKHDRYDHHLNQLAILRAMYKQNSDMAIGVEWFQQSFQTVIDNYLSGKIDETEMLLQSGYYQRWRYDYRMLRPILEFAKTHKLPVIALNAPQEITGKVSKHGLDGLSEDERQQIPAKIHPSQPKYRAYLEEVFKEHMGGHGDLDHFILVQRIWDETMAMNTVKYLQSNPGHRMVVFAGSGHLGREAMPGDVARSIAVELFSTVHSIEAEDIKANDVEPDAFDYFILSEQQSLPPTGKLGAWLDDKDNGVSIFKLAEDSAASDAGLKKGDHILQMDEQTIDSMADLLIMLADRQPGDEVEVLIKRDNEQLRYVFPLK